MCVQGYVRSHEFLGIPREKNHKHRMLLTNSTNHSKIINHFPLIVPSQCSLIVHIQKHAIDEFSSKLRLARGPKRRMDTDVFIESLLALFIFSLDFHFFRSIRI